MPPEAGKAFNAAGQLEGFEVFIKYLPPQTTEESLRAFFEDAGEMVGVPRLLMNQSTGKCKGVGWITFATQAGMSGGLRLDGAAFGGRHLSVTAAKQAHYGVRPTLQAPGTHTPALLREVVASMVGSDPGGTFVDATFGRGGHTRGLLSALSPRGRLHAFDMDPEAITAGEELRKSDDRFAIHHAPFSSMAATLAPLGLRPSAIFFDLGISSPQFDEAHRGFRPEADGPLDLRFDQSKGVPAWEYLEQVERSELVRILHLYGETSDAAAARRIADAICLAREAKALPRRTREFAAMVAEAKGREYQPMHPAKLTFQALRIHLNDEFGECRAGLAAAFELLGEGGRIGLITWKHSECQLVVDFFRSLAGVRDDRGVQAPLHRWYSKQPEGGRPPLPADWSLTMDEAIRPSEAELQANSRSRSAVLHVLRKRRMPRLAELERVAYPLLGWGHPHPYPGAHDEAGGEAGGEVGGDAGGAGGSSKRREAKERKERKAERKALKAKKMEAEAAPQPEAEAHGGGGADEKEGAAVDKAAKKRKRQRREQGEDE